MLRRLRRTDKAASQKAQSGQPNSLFGEILDWMLAPLLFLWPISIIVTHNVAGNIANQPYDLALADSVRALARLVSVQEGCGEGGFPCATPGAVPVGSGRRDVLPGRQGRW